MLKSFGLQAHRRVEASPGQGRVAEVMGWALFAILDVATRRTVYGDATFALALSAVLTPLVILLAQGIARTLGALGLEARLTIRSLGVVLPLCMLGALVMVAVGIGIRSRIGGPMTPDRAASEDMLATGFYFFMIFSSYCLIRFWVHTEAARRREADRAVRAEAEALRAELQRLRLQLNPHFLLNALNGIMETVERDPEDARGVIEDLAVFLRHVLDDRRGMVTTVGEEMDALSAYLGVQSSRFAGQMSTTLDVDVNALSQPIAGFLLQPLVENAVEHRVRAGDAQVSVTLRSKGDTMKIEVRNPGRLCGEGPAGMGIGLANVRERLALHYPGRHSFDLCEDAGDVVAVLTMEGVPCSAP